MTPTLKTITQQAPAEHKKEDRMAEIRNEEVNGRIRTTVHLEPGERIKLCRCHKSAEYPLCDHAHKQLDGNIGPVVIFAPVCSQQDGPEPSEKK